MDALSILIGLAVCLVTAVILYFISVNSFKEKTYEEVLAEQKKFADSLLTTKEAKAAAKEKEKKQKKPVKKQQQHPKEPKEPKASSPPLAHQVSFDEKLHVEFEPDAEIIPEEPVAHQPREKEAKKKGDKKEKMKPILRNKDHVVVAPESFDPDVDSINHFADNPPKDDVEKAKDHKAGKAGGNKQPRPVVEDKFVAEEAPVVEPVAVKETAFLCGPAAPAPAQPVQPSTPVKKPKRRSAKGDSMEAVDPGEELLLQLGGTEKLLVALKSLPFTAAELQTTIELLLNRQQEAGAGLADSEWMERGGRLDPIGALRKQLSDKEKALAEELEEKQVYQNKLRTLGAEMAAERTRAAAARKQLEESLARQTGEMQLLTVRLQQAADQHTAEMAALRAQHKAALQQQQGPSEEHLRQLQRLQEEKAQLEARYAAAQQATQEIGARVQQLEDVIRHREAQSTAQQHEVVQLREALQATAMETRARLEETERTKQLLEDRITTVDRELLMERSIAAQKEAEVRQELQRLCLENQSLHHQLSSTSETRRDDDLRWEQLLRDKEKVLEEQRQQAAEAHKELERLRAETASLVQQLDATKGKDEELEEQRRKNNELRDKNYKAMDALAAAEKALLDLKKSAAAAASKPSDPSEVQSSISAGLQRAFPDLSLDPSSSPASFAESLASQLTDSVRRLEQAEASKAAAQVQHYKTVLSQTEELLLRLQSRVEDEEAGWKARLSAQEADMAAVRQERDFWMEQCQKQPPSQSQSESVDEVDVSSLQSRIESLSKEKERILEEADRERQAAQELSAQLEEARASLAEERRTAQHLQEQLDQAKAELSAAKVGSMGYMVSWAKGAPTSAAAAAFVAATTARKNSLVADSPPQAGVMPAGIKSSMASSPTTNGNGSNGNGTAAESPLEEQPTGATAGQQSKGSKSRKKNHKAASHFAS